VKNKGNEDSSPGKGPMDDRGVRLGRYVLFGLCVAAAIYRWFGPESVTKRLDWQFLLLVVAAGSMLLLPYLSKVTFGKGRSLTFGQRDRNAVRKFGVGGKPSADGKKGAIPRAIAAKFGGAIERSVSAKAIEETEAEALKKNLEAAASDDPQKRQWGGKEEENGYRLGARVDQIEDSPDWFSLELKVAFIEKGAAAGEKVRFHLHPTFRKAEADVPIEEGEATLHLVAWGAFTAGAEVFDAKGQQLATLELDLSKLPSAPKAFRE
jgi:hypothetical protein